jgi:DNA replication protein DnaC
MIPNAAAIATVRGWQHGKRGILASGPTGLGKTRAIADLYRRLACEEGRDVRYFNAADWFAALGAQVKYGRDDAAGWVREMARKPIFILDDLGQEAVQKSHEEWAQSWFFRFLDIRREHGLPLIVSTNLSAEQITGRHDRRNLRADPLLQRLLDLCEVVKFRQPGA